MIAKSDSGDRSRQGRIWFGCEHSGKEKFKKIPNVDGFKESKKCGCPFKLKCGQLTLGDQNSD